MILDDVTSFWWESITGPQLLVERIAACLSDGNSVVLQIDNGLPWQEQMRDFVAHHLSWVKLHSLNWSGEVAREQIVSVLLNKLFRNGLSACPADYKAQLNYIKSEKIFANSVVWVSNVSGQNQTALLQFLSDYRGKALASHGAFVVEVPGGQNLSIRSDRCIVIRCSEYIRHSDLLLYASILTDGIQTDLVLKNYMACAATNLAGQNAELIPEILHGIDFAREDPARALSKMWDEGRLPCPDNRPNEQELQLQVWAAQLQSVFAQIEVERLHIVDEYVELIEQALTVEYWDSKKNRSGFIQQYGDELESAFDVELGTLVRMMSLRRNDDRKVPMLSFPDQEIKSRIIFLKECRNNLAHHRACTPEQMCCILNFSKDR